MCINHTILVDLYSFMHKHTRAQIFSKSRTSQSSRQQEVCPIFLDEVFCDLLQGRSASQKSYVAEEFRSQRQRRAKEISPLDCKVIYFPAAKLPEKQIYFYS